MSFLFPLFLLGAGAIAAPIIFHLIRRVTRDKVPFSTLMFLKPSPPKLTRKSRIQHLFLLLLRCLVLLLLALAFARPYFSGDQTLNLEADERVRHCILLDRSASMQRDGLWDGALEKTEAWLRKWQQESYVSVFVFDESIQQVASFAEWSAMNDSLRVDEVMNRLAAQSPNWKSTALDIALLESLNRMEEGAKEEDQDSEQQMWELVVVSDIQSGSRFEGLRGQDWPKHAYAVFDRVEAGQKNNAGLQALQTGWQISEDNTSVAPRIRLANALESESEQFQIVWHNDAGPVDAAESLPMYVTPGRSRITTAPAWPASSQADRLVLSGDEAPFDNVIWLAPYKPKQSRIVLLSSKQDTANTELEFYLQRAFQTIPGHEIELIQPQTEAWDPMAALRSVDLWIVPQALNTEMAEGLLSKIEEGGTLLMPISSTAMQDTLRSLWQDPNLEITEAAVTDYALFGKIDFQHPLFAPFSDPRFSDFSKIHFWKHRDIRQLDEGDPAVRVAARFDNDLPAVLTRQVGQGRIVLLTSSWIPQDSQLALSTKFVPWLYTILNWGRNYEALRTQYTVGEPVDLSSIPTSDKLQVRKPDDETVSMTEQRFFHDTLTPGMYQIEADNDFQWTFAVNLAPAESRTSPLPLETLEGLGVPTRAPESVAEDTPESREATAEETRLLEAKEIEDQQKFWKWALLGALGMVFLESMVASRASRQQRPSS